MNFNSQLQRRIPGLDPKLLDLVVIFISIKVAFLMLAYLNYNLLPFNWDLYNINLVRDIQDLPASLRGFNTWDTQHYLLLADVGYGVNPMSDAFYPLYPLLIKLTTPLFAYKSLLAALTISNLASLLVPVYMYKLVRLFEPEDQAFRAAVLLLAFPTAFFMSVAYTEALFLAFTLMAFYFLSKEEVLKASLCCFLLPLVRAQGLLMIAPVLVMMLTAMAGIEGSLRERLQSTAKTYLVPVFASCLGIICYLIILNHETGDFYTGFSAQHLFVANNSFSSLFNPYDWFVRNFIDIDFSVHGYTTSLIDRIAFLVFLPALVGIYFTQNKALFLYAALMMLIPALSGSLMSYMRMLLVVFPLCILLSKYPRTFLPQLFIMFAIQVFFFLSHTGGYWVA